MDDGEEARPGPEHLVVGQVTKPHGTKGEVFVWPLTDRPVEMFAVGAGVIVGDANGEAPASPERVVVERVRPFKRGLLVKFEDRADLEAVAPLAGVYLLVPTGEVAPLEEGEVFYHDLLGLEVWTAEGERVGRVREVYETEPAHLLEVEDDAGKLRLVPFAERIVKEVDLDGGRVVIRPPPGLLEL